MTGPLVVEMYQRVLAGDSLYRIRKDWNERGILTTHGCAWSDRTLKMVLYTPSNKGVREYRPVMPDGSRAKTSKMQVKAAWPALVDEDTWQQVSDVLDARKKARNFHQPGSGAAVRMYPFSGLNRCSLCGTSMIHRGGVYQCLQPTLGGCTRSIRSAEIERLVEEAVLATFKQITLHPTKHRTSGSDLAARIGLVATLDQDRERLGRLDDDYYDGLIDKAMWVRQRARIAERIEATRRQHAARMSEQHAGLNIDMTTVAAEWEGRTTMWQYQAASLILQAVLVHAHPADMMTAVPKRRNESTEDFHVRRDAHRAAVLARRVEFIWRA
ncbi:recombinase family protein [Micrococcoides hystricis]|uniref:Recombinase family protein n=1 Tax=Micrococcoides hystricis TaxID=1572761 RepID=A0ABV6P9D5_9MICC